MGWRESKVVEERLRFVVLASRGERTMSELCREFGISRQTGYVWWKRYQEGGSVRMQDRSRRPLHSPRRTAADLEQKVIGLRRQWPDWGAAKLAEMLSRGEPDVRLPARTVHRILVRHGLIDHTERHRAATQRFERAAPNELWQMDFKSGAPQSAVGPLSVLDDHSRYLILLRRLGSTQLIGVQRSLEETFRAVGLPESMLMDHGTPWWNGASPWGLTELSVWIMRLGIRLIYSGVAHPQTQGKVERMHGALERAVRRRAGDREDQQWLDAFRAEYNHLRPHEALRMATPASVWRRSSRAFPERLPEWEYASGTLCLQLGGEGQLGWKGRRWEISRALRRQRVGIEQLGDRAIVYFCRTPVRELDLRTGAAIALLGAPRRSLQC
jgi:transposase InsO family protein